MEISILDPSNCINISVKLISGMQIEVILLGISWEYFDSTILWPWGLLGKCFEKTK